MPQAVGGLLAFNLAGTSYRFRRVSGYVLNALNRFRPQPVVEVVAAPERLQLKEEPKADVARYDRLLKKLAVAAIAAMPMLMAAVSNRVAEAPYGTP
jgi:hypothetical protein